MKYQQYAPKSNGWSEWINPVRKGYRLSCCDCALIHIFEFRLVKTFRGQRIEFRCRRHNRATAQMRRGRAQIEKLRNLATTGLTN